MHRPERRPELVEGLVETLSRAGRGGPAEEHRPALTYALFTFLSCFLELGLVIDAVARGRPLWEPGVLLLTFHMATLLAQRLTIPWPARGGSLAVGSLLLLTHPGGIAGTAAGVFLARLALRYLYNDSKAQASPGGRHKALPRLIGFTLAALYSPLAFAALSLLALGVYLFGFPITRDTRPGHRPPKSEISNLKSEIRIYLTLAFHSAHYFAFGYGVPALFAGRYGFPVASLGLVYTAGWLGYYLISRLLPPSPRYLAWGHLVSALGILVLAISPAPCPALLAWTATGFGGGTIFMLSHLRATNPYDPTAMDPWDNGANVVGLLLFLGSWGQGAPGRGFLAAAALAIAAATAAAGLRETPHQVTPEPLGELAQS